MALARPADYRAFVAAAASDLPGALANNRYSADAVAVAGAGVLRDLPDLPADNALPRWLEEVAGLPRGRPPPAASSRLRPGLARRRRPRGRRRFPPSRRTSPFAARLAAVRSVLADRRAELTVAGRTSSGTLVALERRAACRVRALIEERGLRAASRLAQAPDRASRTSRGRLRRSSGSSWTGTDPAALGRILARLGDAAIVDTRVLLAHRLGADEAGWAAAEDRFASDLLLPDRIADPWLRA